MWSSYSPGRLPPVITRLFILAFYLTVATFGLCISNHELDQDFSAWYASQSNDDIFSLFWPLIYMVIGTASLVFVVGQITGNVSQVDKLWSIIPALYTCGAFDASEWFHIYFKERGVLQGFLTTVWGVRLTYNFYRRGGYSWPPWKGEEDYRWVYVRQWPIINTKVGWTVFNLLFISAYQIFLLLLQVSPAVASCSQRPLTWLDWLVAANFLSLVIMEALSDQQQYDFQEKKWGDIKSGRQLDFPYSVGFPTSDLFSVSRHPNYLCEITLWFLFYLFSLAAGLPLANWSLCGSVLLALLFLGSTRLAESISSSKYSAYRLYQKRVDRWIGLWSPFRSDFEPLVLAKDLN